MAKTKYKKYSKTKGRRDSNTGEMRKTMTKEVQSMIDYISQQPELQNKFKYTDLIP